MKPTRKQAEAIRGARNAVIEAAKAWIAYVKRSNQSHLLATGLSLELNDAVAKLEALEEK